MSEPLTTEQMREALLAAGKRVKSNASADDIAMAHLELEAEQEAAAAADESEVGPETGPDAGPPAPPETSEVQSANATGETINDVIIRVRAKVMAENKRDYMGDKEPEVVAWARENLTPEEFETRYAGRLK